jgi:cobalt-zinc-cadmium efflux system outer membrane protein
VRQVPLEPPGLPARIEAARSLATTPTDEVMALPFAEAVARLRRHNPRVVDARAAALSPQALARTPAPLPNPTLALGPVLLTGLSGVSGAAWGLESALGWSAVLGGKRQMLDSMHAQEARAAVVNAVAVEREEYLGLRRDWLDSAMRAREEQVRATLLGTAQTARDGIADLVHAQSAAAVDLVLLDLDARRLGADQIEADAQTVAARARLAQRIGADTEDVAAPTLDSLPPLPPQLPTLAQLRRAALAGNPRLDRLRADYTVAEQRLRLEASRAIPDLKFGGTYEHDDLGSGFGRLGLPLGIELPIFDRNQKALAAACAERDALRTRFHAAYTRILGEIESARELLRLRRQRVLRYQTDVSPAAAAALETGKQALLAGQTDALRFVNLLRSTRVVEREQVGALRQLYLAWAALEQAVGGPLLRFPDEPQPAPTGAHQEDA